MRLNNASVLGICPKTPNEGVWLIAPCHESKFLRIASKPVGRNGTESSHHSVCWRRNRDSSAQVDQIQRI